MLSRVNDSSRKSNAIRDNAFARNYAEVDRLLSISTDIADINEAIVGYALARDEKAVSDLLKWTVHKIAGKNAAVYGYAIAGHEKEVNALLLDSNVSKYYAIVGYMEGKHKDKEEKLLKKFQEENELLSDDQYRKQKFQHKKQRTPDILRTILGALAAVFLAPFSLLITLPLWFKTRNKDVSQKSIPPKKKDEEQKDQVKESKTENKKNTRNLDDDSHRITQRGVNILSNTSDSNKPHTLQSDIITNSEAQHQMRILDIKAKYQMEISALKGQIAEKDKKIAENEKQREEKEKQIAEDAKKIEILTRRKKELLSNKENTRCPSRSSNPTLFQSRSPIEDKKNPFPVRKREQGI